MKIGLILDGPFQAWGIPSEYNTRGAAYQPTKRGIVGLIGCCMGISRGDAKLEYLNSVLNINVDVRKDDNGNLKSGSMMVDFQTVSKEDGTKLNAANGGQGESKNIPLKKSYLTDASFLVHIESSDESLMEQIYNALNDPVWVPYLGRRNCMPTEPLIPFIEE